MTDQQREAERQTDADLSSTAGGDPDGQLAQADPAGIRVARSRNVAAGSGADLRAIGEVEEEDPLAAAVGRREGSE